MANPFGSLDETLAKNTSHTNQALLYKAVVPRSASKVVEVVGAVSNTGVANGSYDSDGYFFGTDSTRRGTNFALSPTISLDGYTIIAGFRFNGSGGSSGGDVFTGMVDSVGLDASLRFELDAYARRMQPQMRDSNSTTAGLGGVWYNPGANDFAGVLQCKNGAQKAYVRTQTGGGTNDPSPPATSSTAMGGSAVMNFISLVYCSLYGTQYMFIYNDSGTMSETDINNIIADPGSVVGPVASGQPSGRRMGGVRNLGKMINRGVW